MITIKSKAFGELAIPKEGKDTQANLEKYMEGLRERAKEYEGDDGKTVFMDKNNRTVLEEAMKVGWIAAYNVDDESPKKNHWIADGIRKYIADCMTVDPS